MPKISADPDDIEDFARELREFYEETHSRLQNLEVRLEEADWDDARYRGYRDEFDEIKEAILVEVEDIEYSQALLLEDHAQILREYLGK